MANTSNPLIGPAAGSVGGTAFQQGASGIVLRAKRKPANPQTPNQIRRRAALSSISAAWRGLTQAERDAWNAAASELTTSNRLGQSAKLSGANYFLRVNANSRLAGGSAIITEPPHVDPVVPPLLTSVDGTLVITFSGSLPTGYIVSVRASRQVSPGRASAATGIIANYTSLGAGGTIDLAPAYTQKYGALITGKKVVVEASIIDVTTGAKFNCGKAVALIG